MRTLVDVLVSQCGFRADRLTVGWALGGFASFELSRVVRGSHDVAWTVLYFAATSAFYYLGNAWWLSRWSAAARRLEGVPALRAWQLYQSVLGLMFFNQALGFAAIASLTFPGSALAAPVGLTALVGGALVLAGTITKTWATLVVGIDCYYYKDLFFRRRVWRFSREGPYALFSSPMYGVGNLHLYGLAIVARSIPGLVAAAICHVAIFSFYFALERPFVRTALAANSEG
jgi:hypothetical protein